MIIEILTTRAMSIIQNIISCMRGYRSGAYSAGKLSKIKFGVALSKLSEKSCQHLPTPLLGLLVYLSIEGVKTRDMFRRPGNSVQMKKIIEMMAQGIEIEWHNYNIYTVANVVKKYFISLPGGLFGVKCEMILLATYSFSDENRRATFMSILNQLPVANRELAILMFGILFRMVSNAVDDYALEMKNGMNRSSSSECTESVLAEAVAKSVAGSIFHLCTTCPENVEKAASVLRGLILDFPSFDDEFVEFYYRSTVISYEGQCSNFFRYSPPQISQIYSNDMPRSAACHPEHIPNHNMYHPPPIVTITNECGDEESLSTNSSPMMKRKMSKDVDNFSLRSTKSSDYDKVKQRQLDQMRIRSDWFLNSGSCNDFDSTVGLVYDHYESNEDDLMLSPDRQLQYQIVATSGPDILQTQPKGARQHDRDNDNKTHSRPTYSYNLTVPNQYDKRSLQSSQLSSCGNNSRSSFLDEVYSDF